MNAMKSNPYKLSTILLTIYVASIVVLSESSLEAANLSQAIGFLLAGVFLFEFFISHQRIVQFPREFAGFIALLIWIMLGVFWAIDPSVVLQTTVTMVQLIGLSLIMFNITLALKSLMPFIIGTVGGVLVAVYEAIRENNFDIAGSTINYVRVGSLLSNPNTYGVALGVGIMAALYWMQRTKNRWGRLVFAALMLLFAYHIVFFTGSRKAILSLPVILISYVGLYYSVVRRSFSLKTVSAVLLVMVMTFTLGNTILDLSPYADRFDLQDSGSFLSRAAYIRIGISFWVDNPFIGYGAKHYQILEGETYAHNNYVQMLVDVGLIGTIFYYSFYYFTLRTYLKKLALHQERDFRIRAAWAITYLLLLLFWDVGVVTYYNKFQWLSLTAIVSIPYMFSETPVIEAPEAASLPDPRAEMR